MKLTTQLIGHKGGKECYHSTNEYEILSYVDLVKGLLEIVKEHEDDIEDIKISLKFKGGKSIEVK